jgi:hypothetical protein
MNPASLSGFRISLLNRVRTADRLIAASTKRKNHRAELDKLTALQAIELLDTYVEKANEEQKD